MRTIVLGAGKHQRIEGALHHDQFMFDGIDFVFDLNDYFSCELNLYRCNRIIATHVVEHLDNIIHFMNECYHLLETGGTLEIETPNAGVNPDLEFCDPTHVRCYRPHTWTNYFTKHGIEKFGYTALAWEILTLETFQLEVPNDTIRVILTPIK